MIKFRQKEYSKKQIKFVRGVKKAVDSTHKSIINNSLSLQRRLGIDKLFLKEKNPTQLNAIRRVRVPKKTGHQLTREAVETVNRAQEFKRGLVMNPINENIDRGIKFTAGNPITATSTLSPFPGTTVAGKLGEDLLKSKSKTYQRITRKIEDGYAKSKVSRGLKKTRLPSINELSQTLLI